MTISVDDVLALPATATIVNAGRHAGRRELRGAVRYRPADLLEAEHLTLPIAHDATVVLYDEHGPSAELEQIAGRFRDAGFTDVRILAGDLATAEAAGAPTQEASTEQVVPPHRAGEVQALDRRI